MTRDYKRSYSRSPPKRSRSRSSDKRAVGNGGAENGNGAAVDHAENGSGRRGGSRDRRTRSRSRDRSRDRRERSRSRDRYRDRSRDRSRSRNRSYDRLSDEDLCRIHIADLTDAISQHDIEKNFRKFGDLKEVWMAKNPPCFAFVVFKNKEDAALAVKEMDGR